MIYAQIVLALTAQAAEGGSGGGIDPVVFMFIVGGLCTAITSLATLLWRRVETENKELRKKLAVYEDIAPQFIEAVERMTAEHGGRPSAPRRDARLPYPYQSRRSPTRGGRRRPS